MIAGRKVVLVCGGRNYANKSHLYHMLDSAHAAYGFDLLVEGGAEGADKLAARWAMDIGVDRVTVWANWTKYDRKAGPRRNEMMLELMEPDLVIAFPGGKGTRNMVSQARSKGIKIVEVD